MSYRRANLQFYIFLEHGVYLDLQLPEVFRGLKSFIAFLEGWEIFI
jgi:hypothetical protein